MLQEAAALASRRIGPVEFRCHEKAKNDERARYFCDRS